MRLDACALNYYSYRIAVKFSPVCLCGQSIEDISHCFSSLCYKLCPENERSGLAARIVPSRWDRLSEKEKVGLLLFGSVNLIITTTVFWIARKS